MSVVSVILTLLVIVITLHVCSAFEFDFWDQSFSPRKFGCCRTLIVITVLAHTATGADAFPQKTRKKLILMPHDISVQVCKFEILIPLQVALQSGRYISNGDFQSKRAKNGVPNFLVQLCSLLTLGSLTKHGEGNGRKGAQLISTNNHNLTNYLLKESTSEIYGP